LVVERVAYYVEDILRTTQRILRGFLSYADDDPLLPAAAVFSFVSVLEVLVYD